VGTISTQQLQETEYGHFGPWTLWSLTLILTLKPFPNSNPKPKPNSTYVTTTTG